MSRWLQVYVVPPAVFASVTIGGGYGTGREVVEFFSRYGGSGGLLGMLVATTVLATVYALSFDFARRMGAYEYRAFFRRLIGPLWWTYELLYLLMFLLVLGVLSAAAGNILSSRFTVPGYLGLGFLLFLIGAMVFFGREVLERILTGWMFAMYGVFLLYFLFTLRHFGDHSAALELFATREPGAMTGGALYALYNVSLVPVLLFAVRGLKTRRESVGCGVVTAVLVMLPAALFHTSFALGLPEILDEPVPVYRMIEQFAPPWMLSVYLIALLGTLVQTGAGLVQGLIERVEVAVLPGQDGGMNPLGRALIAMCALGVGAALASLGIISLIAKGYSAMSVGFAIVYVIPLLTISYLRKSQSPAEAGSR
jgi:uncharacterized membrane protein YkvI